MTRIVEVDRHSLDELKQRLRTVTAGNGHQVYEHCDFRPVVVTLAEKQSLLSIEESTEARTLLANSGVFYHDTLVYCTNAVTPDRVIRLAQINENLEREFQTNLFDLAEIVAGDPAYLVVHFEEDGQQTTAVFLPPIIEHTAHSSGHTPHSVPVVVHSPATLWLAHQLG
ncbi:unnamed protein product, partial [marine sediment metagenome]